MKQSMYINRELSWIEFNARVLHEACRKELPLLERLTFLGIVTSNFDEFFQVRVASIKRAQRTNPRAQDVTSCTPSSLLRQISARCHELIEVQHQTLTEDILPALAKAGIEYVVPQNLSAQQKSFCEDLFTKEVFPLLTPLRTDGEEFPLIGNLRLHAAFLLDRMSGVHAERTPLAAKEGGSIIALVQVPPGISRIVWLPSEGSGRQFALLDDIIMQHGTELFPGYTVKESMLFKVTRDADVSVDEDSGENFIQAMEEVLAKRQSGFAVRMVCTGTSAVLRSFLTEKLFLKPEDVYKVQGLMDPSTLTGIAEPGTKAELRYPEWKHFFPAGLPQDAPLWSTISQGDVLLNVPYESYDPVLSFIRTAAEDPDVLAIKMTLYRTGSDSPIVRSLIEAAHRGKQVTVFVELKARFDEQRNISWAAELEQAGAIVIYGVVNLKVHAKILMVIRRESDGMKRYVHLSTGNYNAKTARLYQDFSLFTANREIAGDATLFFNIISGYSAIQTMHHLYMAPVTLKSRLIEMIEREIKRSTKESPGLIVAKMNSLSHREIIDELYKASQAGVRVMLNVRGICMLVPGVKGLSENIQVTSIIDRYLEHSRVFYFQNGGKEELYLSSADWMERNLDRRIELMVPVTDRKVAASLKDMLLLYFTDNTHSYTLRKDGTWKANESPRKDQRVSVQETLYRRYKRRNDARRSAPRLDVVVRRKD